MDLLLFNFWRSFIDLTKEIPGNGGVAQLGEHLPCKQGVMGSNPIISTSPQAGAQRSGTYGEEL